MPCLQAARSKSTSGPSTRPGMGWMWSSRAPTTHGSPRIGRRASPHRGWHQNRPAGAFERQRKSAHHSRHRLRRAGWHQGRAQRRGDAFDQRRQCHLHQLRQQQLRQRDACRQPRRQRQHNGRARGVVGRSRPHNQIHSAHRRAVTLNVTGTVAPHWGRRRERRLGQSQQQRQRDAHRVGADHFDRWRRLSEERQRRLQPQALRGDRHRCGLPHQRRRRRDPGDSGA